MAEPDICGKCSERDNCKKVYQLMADYRGPSVLGKVFLAFVFPLLIFVVSLAVFDSPTAKWTESKELAIILNLLISAGLTGVYIMAVMLVLGKFRKSRETNSDKNGKNKA